MKPVIEIAKAELKRLFYSPVAWLVMIVFGYQVFRTFSGTVNAFLSVGEFKGFSFSTFSFFSSMPFVGEFFIRVQGAFYLYIPLLTMNILSRDFSSGSIKLLFSSPLSTRQIITGKYLSLLTFIFLMTCVVAIPSFYMAMQIENVEWPLIFNGLLGMFLLASCYAAIGLYISSLTHYPLIAVISTFAVLFLLNSIGQFWQDIPFVRDLTYWFSVSGRSTVFIQGMISTESVIYFFAVIGFFLAITIIRMNGFRGKRSNGRIGKQYLAAISITVVIGYVSSLPAMIHYWDLTRSDLNTISREGQKIVEQIDGDLTITSYTNMLDMETNYLALPSAYKTNVARFDNYVRFKPATKVDFKYYYHFTPDDFFAEKFPGLSPEHILDSMKEINDWNFDIQSYDELKKEADLASEDFRFVTKIETSKGQKTFLRVYDDNLIYPNEMQISAALKRITEDLPTIGFTAGHGERNIDKRDDKNYWYLVSQKSFRYSLVNNGFDVETISLAKPVPAHIRILVIADVKQSFTDAELINYNDYLSRGGNILIAAEPGRQAEMASLLQPLGIELVPGTLLQPKKQNLPELNFGQPSPLIDSLSYLVNGMWKQKRAALVFNKTAALEYNSGSGYNVFPLATTDSVTWNELQTTDFVNDSAIFDPASGEQKKEYTTALTLSRNQNNRQQRIIVTGDADWLSTGELTRRRERVRPINFMFLFGAFHYLSDGELPVDMRRDPSTDNVVNLKKADWEQMETPAVWGFPGLMLLAAVVLLIRRKGR